MNSNIPAINEQLQRIANALENRAKPQASLGFFDYARKVYCNTVNGNGDGWYSLHDGNALTEKPVFRGLVVSISFPSVERQGKEVRKFHLVMTAGEETVTFESGHNCFFSKTILAAIAKASPEILAQPIQLVTYVKTLNTGDKTLAVSLSDSLGNRLACDWQNDDDWKSISLLAMSNVNEAIVSR